MGHDFRKCQPVNEGCRNLISKTLPDLILLIVIFFDFNFLILNLSTYYLLQTLHV